MLQSEEQIIQQLKLTMEKMFDVQASQVVPDARLYEDLDIDSIDAVNMIIELRRETGRTIPAEHFRTARTVDDVVRIVHKILQQDEPG